MSALIDRYWEQYASKKKSQDREKAVLEGIRSQIGDLFVREVDGAGIQRWYQGLTGGEGAVGGNGRSALQRHAPHDGEGRDDLVARKPA